MAVFKLLVGLGNPGSEYENTRHNAGAQWIEALARQSQCSLRSEKKFFGEFAKAYIGGEECYLLIPTTYMNLSGKSVQAVCQFYKILPEQVLVIHDELDIPPGTVKLKKGGGHGGHNGLKDIISKLGNNRDFGRLRIGIGHPGHASQVASYVLKKAPAEEYDQIEKTIDESLCYCDDIVRGELSNAMNHLHSFKA
ncbi:aminoacyl-tRNA hydrolase [Marinomonas mediterranea]|uniref:aminoacyl-tRNA hydrolase n=1 Tax=Marinomonas mediterranea TaxID=119864 RepID=UPI00234AAD3C|nr:aminoacyl-tRNA hydrolase [Marinomonas mediterranea]WCN10152.1 aminoacyl-tRNA hydrolase [Marinomonas mediterranea]WCN14197.1 aminoacyl-tRNA hydrolase [Marinomonas mediterranea]